MIVRGSETQEARRNTTKMAFNIKTTQDMLGLTCRDFSPLFTGVPQVLELNHFQLMFNQFRAAHACNAHLSWMNNTGPPTEHSGSLPHMPKHPFVLTTETKKKKKGELRYFMCFDVFWQARHFPALALYKLDNAAQQGWDVLVSNEPPLAREVTPLITRRCAAGTARPTGVWWTGGGAVCGVGEPVQLS